MNEILNIAIYVSREYNVPVDSFMKSGNYQSDAKHVFRCILKQRVHHSIVTEHLGISRTTLDYSYNFCKQAKKRKAERFSKIARVAFPSDEEEHLVHFDPKEKKVYINEPQNIITEKIKMVFNIFSNKFK